jgi:hypothetical protein
LAIWENATRMAILLSVGAACMMAIVVEIYHADLLPDGSPLPRITHVQAFVAACAGFIPAFLCLQRLNSGSWSRAIRFTSPWLILIPDAILTMVVQLQWYWALAIAIPLGVAAYQAMFRVARNLKNG